MLRKSSSLGKTLGVPPKNIQIPMLSMGEPFHCPMKIAETIGYTRFQSPFVETKTMLVLGICGCHPISSELHEPRSNSKTFNSSRFNQTRTTAGFTRGGWIGGNKNSSKRNRIPIPGSFWKSVIFYEVLYL